MLIDLILWGDSMLKVVYVKVPVSTKIKKDTPLFVIEHQALHNFLKVNNLDTGCVISTATNYNQAAYKYYVAIRFNI